MSSHDKRDRTRWGDRIPFEGAGMTPPDEPRAASATRREWPSRDELLAWIAADIEAGGSGSKKRVAAAHPGYSVATLKRAWAAAGAGNPWPSQRTQLDR